MLILSSCRSCEVSPRIQCILVDEEMAQDDTIEVSQQAADPRVSAEAPSREYIAQLDTQFIFVAAYNILLTLYSPENGEFNFL